MRERTGRWAAASLVSGLVVLVLNAGLRGFAQWHRAHVSPFTWDFSREPTPLLVLSVTLVTVLTGILTMAAAGPGLSVLLEARGGGVRRRAAAFALGGIAAAAAGDALLLLTLASLNRFP